MKKINFPFKNRDSSQWNNQDKNFMNNEDRYWEPGSPNNWTFTNTFEQNFRYRRPNYFQNQMTYQPVDFSSDNFNKKYANPLIKQKPKKNFKNISKDRMKSQQKLEASSSPSSPPPGSEEYRLRMIENSKALVTEKLKNLNKEKLPEIKPPNANEENVLNIDNSKVVCVNDTLDNLKLNVNDLKRIGLIGCPQISLDDDQDREEKEESIQEEKQNNDIINKKLNMANNSPPRSQSSKIINSPKEGSIQEENQNNDIIIKKLNMANTSPPRSQSSKIIKSPKEESSQEENQNNEIINKNLNMANTSPPRSQSSQIINSSKEESIQEENQNNDIPNNIINKKLNMANASPPRSQSSKIINSPRSEGSIAKVLSCMNVSMKRETKQNICPILVKRKKRHSSDFNIQDLLESDKKNDLQKEETISRNDELIKNPCNKFLKDIINNPAPGRFNYELQQLVRSKRSQLSREMRKLAQERIQNLLRKQDNPLLSHIADDLLADPDMAINLSTLPEEVINELTNILGIDINNFEATDFNSALNNMTDPLDGNSIVNPLKDNFIHPLEEENFEKDEKSLTTHDLLFNSNRVNVDENSIFNSSEDNFMKSLEQENFENDKTTSEVQTTTQPTQPFLFQSIRVKKEFIEEDNLEINDFENDNNFLPPTNSINNFLDSTTQTFKKSPNDNIFPPSSNIISNFPDSATQTFKKSLNDNIFPQSSNSISTFPDSSTQTFRKSRNDNIFPPSSNSISNFPDSATQTFKKSLNDNIFPPSTNSISTFHDFPAQTFKKSRNDNIFPPSTNSISTFPDSHAQTFKKSRNDNIFPPSMNSISTQTFKKSRNDSPTQTLKKSRNDNIFQSPSNSNCNFPDSPTRTFKKSQDISTQTLEDNNLIVSSNEPENDSLILKRMDVLETQNIELRSLVLSIKQDILNFQTSLQSSFKSPQLISNNSNIKNSTLRNKKKTKQKSRKPVSLIKIDDRKTLEKQNCSLNETKSNSTNTTGATTTTDATTTTRATTTTCATTTTTCATRTTSSITNASQFISFEGPKGSINDIQTLYHKTYNRLIMAGSEDGFIYLYSFFDGKLLKKYGKGCGSITALSLIFCPNSGSPTLYSGSDDGFFRIHDFENEKEFTKINLSSPIQCIEKNWGYNFIGTSSGQVHKHKHKCTTIQESFNFSKMPIFSLTATKEGPRKVLVVGARHESISVRDAFTGLLLRIFNSEFTTVYKIIIEKNLVYCGTTKPNVHVYQFQSGEKSFELPSGAGTICLKNYFNLLFSGGYNGNVYVFLMKTKELISTIKCTDTMILSLEIWNNMIIYGDKKGHINAIKFPQTVLDNLEKIKHDDK